MPRDPEDPSSVYDWYVQWNNQEGFDPPELFDAEVRSLPGAPTERIGSAIRVFRGWELHRNLIVDLRDVTGDGLPDRITVDRNNYENTGFQTWWVEENTGETFKEAVAWEGIYGESGERCTFEPCG